MLLLSICILSSITIQMNYSFPSSWYHWRKNRRCTKSSRNFFSENCNLGGCRRVLQLNAQWNLLGQNWLYCSDTMMRTTSISTESLWLMWRELTVGTSWLHYHAEDYNHTRLQKLTPRYDKCFRSWVILRSKWNIVIPCQGIFPGIYVFFF